MSKKSSKSDWVDASLALALAAGGGLLVLLSVLTLKSGGLPSGDGVLPVLARAMLGNFGLIPGLLAGLVMAGVGSWMFLANRYEGVVRHLAGALCTVAGLAVLLGALSEDAGGRFGAALGGNAASILTKPGGAIFGLIVLLAPVWLFWFRERIDLGSLLKSAPRSSADSDAHDAGVTVAEAEALAPVMAAPISAGKAAPDLTNPYPEDVRLKGALPAGTLPLDSGGQVLLADEPDDAYAELPDSPYDAALHRWTPDRHEPADEPADEDLADAGDEFDGDELGEVKPLDTGADAGDPFAEHSYQPASEQFVESEADLVEEPVAEFESSSNGATRLTEAYQPPRPSWEVDEDEVEELVPLEVSEALEVEDEEEEVLEAVSAAYDEDEDEDESYGEEDLDDEALSDDDLDEAEDDEDEDDAEFEDEAELDETYAASDSDEDEEDEEEYEEEDSEEELEETLASDDSDEDDDEEYEEEEDSEEELEETYAEDDSDEDEDEEEYEEEDAEEELEETLAADDSDEDDDEEYEEEEDSEEELEETYAEDDSDEDEEEYEEEEEPEQELEEAYATRSSDPEGDSAEAELDPEPAAASGGLQMDLFDEPAAPVVEAAPQAADSGDSEPEVVLAPQAAAGDGARKISAQLLTDAGNLFLAENRVAVSMLQKRFALDFDQSCVILDELQQLGLIGPFVEGAPRDILMDSEEWLELTGQS